MIRREKAQSDIRAEHTAKEELMKRILVVEDNYDLRQFITRQLSDDYLVDTAEDGQKALDLLESKELPDLIISDVMMPNKNGFELCYAVKENIMTSHIPVILLTAKVDVDSKMRNEIWRRYVHRKAVLCKTPYVCNRKHL